LWIERGGRAHKGLFYQDFRGFPEVERPRSMWMNFVDTVWFLRGGDVVGRVDGNLEDGDDAYC
jgi:hypothetical protein